MARKRIHTRTIVVEVYDEEDGTLSIEGRLEDAHPTDSGYFTSRRRPGSQNPPGVLHGMSARLVVDRQTAEIRTSDGAFPYTPHEGCEAMVDWLPRLEGLRVAPGYTAKAREALGGPKGCVHMNTLLQVMANTKNAASAYFLPGRQAQIQRFKQDLAKNGRLSMTDTCHMWRAGGPLESEIRADIGASEARRQA